MDCLVFSGLIPECSRFWSPTSGYDSPMMTWLFASLFLMVEPHCSLFSGTQHIQGRGTLRIMMSSQSPLLAVNTDCARIAKKSQPKPLGSLLLCHLRGSVRRRNLLSASPVRRNVISLMGPMVQYLIWSVYEVSVSLFGGKVRSRCGRMVYR